MPTPARVAFGRFARKFVNDRRTVQISGKMLIASSSTIVGAMKSHAIARSDRPRIRRASGAGVAWAARRARGSMALICEVGNRVDSGWRAVRRASPIVNGSLQLAVFLEDLLPVGEQAVERFLRGALVGDD